MRSKDVRIEIVNLPGAMQERRASAFKVSFEYSDRFKAQQTVQALIKETGLEVQRPIPIQVSGNAQP